MAFSTHQQPYQLIAAQAAIPKEIRALLNRADQPVSPAVETAPAAGDSCGRASRRRHDGTDHIQHKTVQETATLAIKTAVTHMIMSEFMRSFSRNGTTQFRSVKAYCRVSRMSSVAENRHGGHAELGWPSRPRSYSM